MEAKCAALRDAITRASSLLGQLSETVDRRDLEEFTLVCQRFIELKTKFLLIQAIENKDLPSKVPFDALHTIEAKNEETSRVIADFQKSIGDLDPAKISRLVDESRATLESVQSKLDESRDGDIEELLQLAQDELRHVQEAAQSRDWYERAYRKLSEFSGVEVLDDGSVRVLGSHIVRFRGNSVSIDPQDVFVEDIDPSSSSNGICVSEVIERLNALKHLRSIADSLGWRIEVRRDAPLVALHVPGIPTPAILALIGYQQYPLVEWGSANVDAFNRSTEPMLSKLKKMCDVMKS